MLCHFLAWLSNRRTSSENLARQREAKLDILVRPDLSLKRRQPRITSRAAFPPTVGSISGSAEKLI